MICEININLLKTHKNFRAARSTSCACSDTAYQEVSRLQFAYYTLHPIMLITPSTAPRKFCAAASLLVDLFEFMARSRKTKTAESLLWKIERPFIFYQLSMSSCFFYCFCPASHDSVAHLWKNSM